MEDGESTGMTTSVAEKAVPFVPDGEEVVSLTHPVMAQNARIAAILKIHDVVTE